MNFFGGLGGLGCLSLGPASMYGFWRGGVGCRVQCLWGPNCSRVSTSAPKYLHGSHFDPQNDVRPMWERFHSGCKGDVAVLLRAIVA